jgi:hypothetical protein
MHKRLKLLTKQHQTQLAQLSIQKLFDQIFP